MVGVSFRCYRSWLAGAEGVLERDHHDVTGSVEGVSGAVAVAVLTLVIVVALIVVGVVVGVFVLRISGVAVLGEVAQVIPVRVALGVGLLRVQGTCYCLITQRYHKATHSSELSLRFVLPAGTG